ncbi:hypothetical protein L202_03905 [Cryptococcus amylolentus CBS 6039]|uniref:U three protein 23 n=1 Tax=Cryptococcus amylolentus CBS 6039 TaxID=1295533 RepID=A0A1E3HWA2_9TREE|nr:hypothetical protein L202_03905 [Cryptococcus amylolentus CBS 6039]ODN80046.1 hypothetical protein L202_03905 [Cryptococcus amylolentus CBS 6039]
MRQKRAKTYKRVMALYTQTFGFRQPFQVLVSQDVLIEGAKCELNMPKQFLNITQGECKLMITQCCMEALYKMGRDVQKTTDLAKTFERRKCNHRTALEPDKCLEDVIGQTNKHRYIIASQSTALRLASDRIPALPLIHFNARGVLVLSPPSTATVREKNKAEEGRRLEGVKVLEGVVDGGNVVGAAEAGPGAGVEKRARKVKGVNPLSMKKKKVEKKEGEGEGEGGKRRREVDLEEESADVGDGEGKRKRKRTKKKTEVQEAIEELNETNKVAGGEPEGGEASD